MVRFFIIIFTFNQALKYVIYLIKKKLNQTKPKYFFLVFCSVKSSMIFSEFKYIISPSFVWYHTAYI